MQTHMITKCIYGAIVALCIVPVYAVASRVQEYGLVDVQKIDPRIRVELMYATTDNFTGKIMYPKNAKCYLLEHVAQQLKKVQNDVQKLGFGLLIADGFRPIEGQQRLWDAVPDARFVADPKKGGKHTRGTTVDLTLVYLDSGKRVEMSSKIDEFTPAAARDYQGCSPAEKKHRTILQTAMQAHGFETIVNEWWHFDYRGWQKNIPLMDLAFDDLA